MAKEIKTTTLLSNVHGNQQLIEGAFQLFFPQYKVYMQKIVVQHI